MNLETTGNENADTSHVQESDVVNDTPDKTKGSKRMKESVLRINDPEADKQAEEQTAEEPKKGPASKKVTKEKVNKGKEKSKEIIELFQSLNEEQLNEVIDMGFGELQHFGIAEVLGKMAYDLVKGFNNVDCTIQLENQRLAIYPEDVYVTLELPIGGTLINRISRQKKNPFVDEVARRVGKNVERILPEDLIKEWEVAIEGFATASEDAVRVLQNLLLSMTYVKNMIQNFEAMKIAGATACNMIGVIPEVEVNEEETVTSLQAALAKDNFNSPELVEAVKSMFKVTAQLTKLAEEGPPFDIHPSFEQKNSVAEISSFTAVGMIQSSNTEKSVISVGSEEARLCASKSDKQERNNIVGTSFNGGSVASNQTGIEKEGTINVEEIVKSAMADYMDGGGDDAADEFYSEASGTKRKQVWIISLEAMMKLMYGEELDVEAIVKSALEAYMECDEVDEDFVTPFTNKSEPKLGKALVIYANKQRAVTVSRKLTPDERVMYYWLMTTHHGNEEQIIYNDRVVEVMLLEFCSLLPHHEVSSGVISAFCSVLNHMEALKSVTSPKRLFFTTYPALYTVVMSNGGDDDADKLYEFSSNIDKEVSEIPHFAWDDIDMVFFAFCVSKRYYTVCFCFKRRSVVIIDACKDGEDNDLRFTYGCIPEALV
ncbi:hypothetical protein SASPL_143732 [Salvia splendens]|uniref:Uncharacterized protein n=1 Tax=Salvia splendens TaxID=180675 RepID=A0A8X8WNX6_SALSN|nr:hypothetical protein SASPL_143732 [Salvia splendens]